MSTPSSASAIGKFQPDRTMYLRGFDGRGAAAALHSAHSAGLKCTGVFRDFADFAVVVLYDADNVFEHKSIRHLPDFNMANMVLEYDWDTNGTVQPLDSPKNPWIAWDSLSYILANGTSGTVPLWDHATLQSGAFTPASATWTLTGSPATGDQIQFSYLDVTFDYTVPSGGTLADAMNSLLYQINSYSWVTEAPAMAILATNPTGNDLKIQAARYGTVNTSGTTVTWVAPGAGQVSNKFTGLAAGDLFKINGLGYTVASVTSPTSLTLTASAGTLTGATYLAPRGGFDGNMITIHCRAKNTGLTTSGDSALGARRQNNKQLSGGDSDVIWRISIDFTALGIDSLRQCWLTIAPRMANGAAYVATEFTTEISNLAVTDPSSHRALKVAGAGSLRVDSRDDWTSYAGSWSEVSGFYNEGFARVSATAADTVRIRYSCQSTHDLYVGTSLGPDCGIVNVKLDGTSLSNLDCYINEAAPLVTRRKLTGAVAPGQHVVEITLSGAKNASSTGWNFYFDFLEAAVLADVSPSPYTYTDRSPATDYDTDATYKMTPQRLVWALDQCGMHGDVNHYLGVFWWNQRQRVNGTNKQYDVTISGTWAAAEYATITLSGIVSKRTVRDMDIDAGDATVARKVIAKMLVDRINATFSGVWAEVTGAGLNTVTIHSRTPMFEFSHAYAVSTVSGTATASGDLDLGSEGVWEIDETITPVINKAATDWHSDFYTEIAAKSWTCTSAFSMELLNPPDYPGSGKVWAARFASGIQVLTATGFGTEAQAAVTAATNASPIAITAAGHGYNTGDSITLAGVGGNTAANGTWTITRTGANTFTLDGSTGNGAYTTGGIARRNLRTTHCAFVSDVVDYQKVAFKEVAGLMNGAGLTPWLQFGEFLWWFFGDKALTVTGASNASPVEITTSQAHGLSTGNRVIVAGVRGNTGANGSWPITVTSSTKFTLTGSVGNGSYSSGGRVSAGTMAFYDADTAAAAATALGRPLATFYTQDDDPSINAYADANFLRDRIKAHIDTIRTYVTATYASAKYELLWPYDVNFASCYHTLDVPYPQGGRLNRYVNLPSAYSTKAGSGLDRIKMEALSWGATYRNLDNAKATIRFPYDTLSWAKADTRYLLPWFNGGCPWGAEHQSALREQTPHVNFWAYDHLGLLSWDLALPAMRNRSRTI